ncbi:hypothetical protein SAMN05421821_117149 [Mucilaginibacter lappiensis]|uniref:Uncharacterized protein n=1 Tax=Mucilaginibacter lappiensis TaxID=354630 RepID=A0ABR6PQZ0_9SPHI|nr:hypothetical protein [Mucilaginibacter lappiensis]MBB6112196.1 hypothetical protein [Mucilaginibacter lappiensis]SIR98984.1 hypothetical protein SAMN05421821_117149 [Mucilaginibacter lappiensis]
MMKRKFKPLAVLMVLLTISCSVSAQVGKNQVSYIIDGGVFHHQLITLNFNAESTQKGALAVTPGYLKIYVDDAETEDDAQKWALNIAFNHAGTGTAKVNDPITNAKPGEDKKVYFVLQVQANGKDKTLSPMLTTPNQTPGTITITRFGPEGGTVEGTFEGKLKSAGETYTIISGHFVVNRVL